jgi:hypothetical protein
MPPGFDETVSIYLSTSNLKVLLWVFGLFSLNGEPFSETPFADVRLSFVQCLMHLSNRNRPFADRRRHPFEIA